MMRIRTVLKIAVALIAALVAAAVGALRATDASWLEASFRMQHWGGDGEAARRLASSGTKIERSAAFQGLCPGSACASSKTGEDGGR